MLSRTRPRRTRALVRLLLGAVALCTVACSRSNTEISGDAGGRRACGGLNERLNGMWTRIEGSTSQLPEHFRLRAIDDVSGLYDQPDLGTLNYALGDDCASILLIDGAGRLYRTWHITLENEDMHVVGPWSKTSRYRRNVTEPTLAVRTERAGVWANGAENLEVVVRAVDPHGAPIVGAQVSLSTDTPQTEIDPFWPVECDQAGEARFLVSTTHLGEIPLEAGFVDASPDTRQTTIRGIRRRMVVLVQGIKTELDPSSPVRPFPELRAALAAAGFVRPARGTPEHSSVNDNGEDDDGDGAMDDGAPLVADFSYLGGFAEGLRGRWTPLSYGCSRTRTAHRQSVGKLKDMLDEITREFPNVSLSVIGHSQGGLLSLQSLTGVVPPDNRPFGEVLDSVVTLDGALGGTPPWETALAAAFNCWGGDARRDMVRLWHTAYDHDRQGSTATSFAGIPNWELVMEAQQRDVRVFTIGSANDCVFNPRNCGLRVQNNESSQIVDAASTLLEPLGGHCNLSLQCIENSHSTVLRAPHILRRVTDFLGSPTSRD